MPAPQGLSRHRRRPDQPRRIPDRAKSDEGLSLGCFGLAEQRAEVFRLARNRQLAYSGAIGCGVAPQACQVQFIDGGCVFVKISDTPVVPSLYSISLR